ncbi:MULTISPECIES: hypothetical protein [unclassified Paenibacillus]|uniref:hypothetical protein n=1 Tax=unclassified Paenibacillus TaxID=185978 RepID=UPI00110FBADB|nr:MULTISPECIES: hypothetical protein [unclassified Paenibacillus]
MQRLRHRESKATGEPREAAPSASVKQRWSGSTTASRRRPSACHIALRTAPGKVWRRLTAVTRLPRAVRSGRRQAGRAVRRPFAAVFFRTSASRTYVLFHTSACFPALLRLLYREQS